MQIEAAKELRVALIPVSHTTPKHRPGFMKTDMRKLVLDRKNSALIQIQIRQLSDDLSTEILIPVCSHIYAD